MIRWRQAKWKMVLCIVAIATMAQACVAPPTRENLTPTASLVAEVVQPTATTSTSRTRIATAIPPMPTATPSDTPAATATSRPTNTPQPTSTPTPVIHVVEQGELLGRIAQQYDVTVDELAAANGIDPEDVLGIGQELIIPIAPVVPDTAETNITATPANTPTATPSPSPTPEPMVHVVEQGDLLGRIAQRYGVTVDELAEANGIDPDDVLSIGQRLIIPGQVSSTMESSPTPTPSVVATGTAIHTNTPVPATQAPTPSEEATATPQPTMLADIVHVVEQGEYLGVIARRYGIDEDLIARANGITSETILRIGQRLVIPDVPVTPTNTPQPTQPASTEPSVPEETPRADVIHTVERGDTLGAIAVRYDVSVADIAQANDISTNAVLRIGQELVIPSIPVTPSATSTPTTTLTLTPTPTATPTLIRSSETYRFRAPFLLGPLQGASYQGSDARILLNWTSVGILSANQWYLVRVWPISRPDDAIEAWTKATSWRPDGTPLPESWQRVTQLSWQVTVVERLPGDPPWRAASPPSAVRTFTWDLRTPIP